MYRRHALKPGLRAWSQAGLTEFLVIWVTAASLAMASPASAASFSVLIKPICGSTGAVSAVEVREEIEISARPVGADLKLKAPLSIFGVKHVADSIMDFQVADSQGAVPVALSDDRARTPDGPFRHWRTLRPTAGTVVVRYRIPTQTPTEQGGPPYGMKAAGAGVAGNGRGFLVVPEDGDFRTSHLRWDLSDMPAGSVGVISAGRGDVAIDGPPSRLLDQWMLAGPALIFSPEGAPSGFHAYLLGRPPFDAAAMLVWADRAYAALSASFGYLGRPDYNLLVRVLDVASYGTGTAGPGGALISVGNSYWRGQDLAVVHNIVFHEMTHQWVGQIEGEAPWFGEGLTVYVAATLPCRAGLASWVECAEGVNDFARDYYASRGRNWSAARIDATVGDERVRRVPYGRGMLYFAALDSQLLRKSKGKRGLMTVLAPIFAARRAGGRFDQAAWERMLRRELGPKAVDEFRRAIINGATTIAPPSDAFGPCLERLTVTLPTSGAGTPAQGYEWQVVKSARSASCAPSA